MLAFDCWIKRPRQIVGREEGFVSEVVAHGGLALWFLNLCWSRPSLCRAWKAELLASQQSEAESREGMPVIGSLLAILSVLVLWE